MAISASVTTLWLVDRVALHYQPHSEPDSREGRCARRALVAAMTVMAPDITLCENFEDEVEIYSIVASVL